MRTITTTLSALGLLIACAGPAAAVEVEGNADIRLHSFQPANGTAAVLKLGKDFDGGDGVALIKYDESSFGGSIDRAIFRTGTISGGDGSYSIHQMFKAWDETSTKADFGGGLPVAGVHYSAHPVAAAGLNNVGGQNRDNADITPLVRKWTSDPSSNKGLILVPRGNLNASFPGSFSPEIQLASRERVPGSIDSDDQFVSVNDYGSGSPTSGTLEPIEDTQVGNAFVDGISRDNAIIAVSNVSADTRRVLQKYGLGQLDVLLGGGQFKATSAKLEMHSLSAGNGSLAIDVFKMLTSWDEATATWNQFGASGPVAGVDYDSTSLGTINLGGGTGVGMIDITGTVNDWLDNAASNEGLIFVATGNESVEHLLASSERVFPGLDGDDSRLIIEGFEVVPEPGMLSLMGIGGLGLLRRRRSM